MLSGGGALKACDGAERTDRRSFGKPTHCCVGRGRDRTTKNGDRQKSNGRSSEHFRCFFILLFFCVSVSVFCLFFLILTEPNRNQEMHRHFF